MAAMGGGASRMGGGARRMSAPALLVPGMGGLEGLFGPKPEIICRPGRIYAGSTDAVLRVFSRKDHKVLAELAGHEGPIVSAIPMQKGARVCTASRDKTIRIWDTEDWKCAAVLGIDNGFPCLQASCLTVTDLNGGADGNQADLLATAADTGPIVLWNVDEQKDEQVLGIDESKHTPATTLLTVGDRLLSGHGDGSVCLWDCEGWKRAARRQDHNGEVRALCVERYQEHMFVGYRDGTIRRIKIDAMEE